MTNNVDQAFEQVLPHILPVLKASFEAGFAQGVEAGRAQGIEFGRLIGFIEGVNAMTPAVSDGLRHGSSECGRAMQGLKNLGMDTNVGKVDGEYDENDDGDE
jgi:hypothetical protein